MDVQVGDVIITKKPHPCGANRFDVLRVGMDFKIRCQKCGHEIMLPRVKIEYSAFFVFIIKNISNDD